MQARGYVISAAAAFVLLIASIGGFLRFMPGNAELRLTGDMLTALAHERPPKPWHGFETKIETVSIANGSVHIRAHVSGYLIHTPADIEGVPEYDTTLRAIFFRVSKIGLPHEAERPALSRLNSVLTPLGTYIAKHLTEIIPVKKLKQETRGGELFLSTVKSVRVEGDVLVLELQGYRVAYASVALAATGLLCAVWFVFAAWRAVAVRRRGGGPQA